MARSRKPTDEERALWRRVTAEVDPLRPAKPADNAPIVKAKPLAQNAKPGERRPSATSVPSATAKLPYLATGQTASVDRRTADRLRRGRMPMNARLDLHGMSQAEAHRALNDFIERAQADGCRTVLVITGKGLFTQGKGVLRDRLGDWLNMPPVRDKILSFMPAQPRHGGGGAFYVLIKRLRDNGKKKGGAR